VTTVQKPSLCGDPKCKEGVIFVEARLFGLPVLVVELCPTCEAKSAREAAPCKQEAKP
jgi:hypothetical protein